MAGLVERIKIIFDIDDAPGVRGLKSIRTEMANAEGAAGKFKAGWSGATDMVKQNAGALATAGAAAIAAFAAKAGQAFRGLALDAGKFADATGLAVEDASRWMEVAGDIGVKAESVQGSIQKMNTGIAAGKPVFADLGDVVVKTKDGLVDANATFIETVDAIGRIEDPTKRAKAAQDAFGRGYASMSELMKMSAEQLRSKLAEVSDQKVIDEGELAKAKTWRERWDNLKDTFEDVQLGVGELVTSLSPLVAGVANVTSSIVKAATKAADWVFATGKMSEATREFWDAVGDRDSMSRGEALSKFLDVVAEKIGDTSNFQKWKDGMVALGIGITDASAAADFATSTRFREFRTELENLAEQSPQTAQQMVADMRQLLTQTDDTSQSFQEWAAYLGITDKQLAELADTLPGGAHAISDVGDAAEDAGRGGLRTFSDAAWTAQQAAQDAQAATDDLAGAVDRLKGTLDVREATRSFEEAMFNYRASAAPSEADTDALIGKMLTLIQTLGSIPAEQKVTMITALEQGNIDWVESRLTFLARNRVVSISGQLVGSDLNNTKEGRGNSADPLNWAAIAAEQAKKGPGGANGIGTTPNSIRPVVERGTPELYKGGDGTTWLLSPDEVGAVVPLTPGGTTSTGSTIIDATTTINVNAPIYGVTDLKDTIDQAMSEQQRRLVATLKAGRR